MDEPVKILCVDDEKNVLKALRRLFMDEDYDINTAESGEEGIAFLTEEPDVDVVISDYRMPGMNGVVFLQKVFERWPDTIRIVLSGYADTASVVAAINEGRIYKFIPKPWNDDDLKNTIAKAIETSRLAKENRELARELKGSNEELMILNDNLEKLVAERTAELSFRNRVLLQGQHILDTLPVGVLGLDNDGLIVQCNRRGGEFLFKGNQTPPVGLPAESTLPAELKSMIAITSEQGSFAGCTKMLDSEFRIRGEVLLNDGEREGIVLVIDAENA
jgi:two-component system NtrC family sensor kinase